MAEKPIAKVTKRRGTSGFICTRCGKWHMFGVYVAAHAHEVLKHTCDCGQKHEVLDYVVTATGDEHGAPKPANPP